MGKKHATPSEWWGARTPGLIQQAPAEITVVVKVEHAASVSCRRIEPGIEYGACARVADLIARELERGEAGEPDDGLRPCVTDLVERQIERGEAGEASGRRRHGH
jgi:hypothetical protein